MVTRLCMLLLFLAASFTGLQAGNDRAGSDNNSEEIYLITLDQLFTQASERWNVESDVLWEDYSEKEVKVKRVKEEDATGTEEYEVSSIHYGTLVLQVKSQEEAEEVSTNDVNLSEIFNDTESNSDESE